MDSKGCLGTTDWIIEILSKGTEKTKYALYAKSGVKEYWIIYPYEEAVHQFVLNKADNHYQLMAMFSDEDTASPDLLVLNGLFCPCGGSFQNEIIWSYRSGSASPKIFSRKNHVILFYTKSAKSWNFNAQKERSYMMHKYGFKKSDLFLGYIRLF